MAMDIRTKVANTALKYVGTTGGTTTGEDQFINWYNANYNTSFKLQGTAWSAIFVTFILRMTGISESICPAFAGSNTLIRNFLEPKNLFIDRPMTYLPKTGDLIFFRKDAMVTTNIAERVGIVSKFVNGMVYVIEADSTGPYNTNGVWHKSYSLNSTYILGYGALEYEDSASISTPTKVSDYDAKRCQLSKVKQMKLVSELQAHLNAQYTIHSLDTNGIADYGTKSATILALQILMNDIKSININETGIYSESDASKYMESRMTLKIGANDSRLVYLAKGLLILHGYDVGEFNSNFDLKLWTAVKAYQQDHKISTITNLGKVDGATWKHLCKTL